MIDIFGIRVEIDSSQATGSLAALRNSLLSTTAGLSALRAGAAQNVLGGFLKTILSSKIAVAALTTAITALVVVIAVKLVKAVADMARPFVEAADKLALFQSRLKVLSGTDTAFKNLIVSVEKFNTSIEASGSVVQRFIMMRNEINMTSKQAQQLADNFTKIGIISGASAESFKIAALQFSQALGSGVLQGDELRSIMEAMPYLGKVLAEQIGRGVGELKKMGAEGKLTADIIGGAILSATKDLDELYGKMPISLGQVNQRLETQKELLFAHIGQVTGLLDLWKKVVSTSADYVRWFRQLLGDQLANLTAQERLLETEKEMARLRKEKAAIPFQPATYTYLGGYEATQREKEIDQQIKELEQKRSMALNSLIAGLRKEDDETLKDLGDIEAERMKKLASSIQNVSKEMKDAFGDLDMYSELDQALDKIRTKFDEIRKAIEKVPGKELRDSLTATVDAVEKQQLNIETESYNQEKLNDIADKFNKILEKRPALLNDIRDAAKKFSVDERIIIGVISQESSFNPSALGPPTKYGRPKGAMQLLDATARRFNVEDPFNQRQNIMGGTAYLSWLSRRFNGDIDKILAGYNAGEGSVDQYGGVPPFAETIKYVKEIKEKIAAMTAEGDRFNQMLSGLEFDAYEKAANSFDTLDKAKQKYIDRVQLLLEVSARTNMSQEEFNRQLLIEKENLEKIINPNKEMVDALERQNSAIQGNDLTIRGEQTAKLRQEQEQFTNQLDKTSASLEENQKRGLSAIQQRAYAEQMREVGIQIKEVARAQEQFNIENELAQKLVAQNAVSEQEYQRWLIGRKEALNNIAEPNKKMLDDLEAELAIYRQFAGMDNGEKKIQQSLAMRQAIESLNKTSPTYDQDVERIKSMTTELEAFKEQLSVTNNQVELFKEAATGIYEAWTGTFESIFEKGIEGFRDMKDEIINLFKKMLAQMIATATARPVVVPIIQTMGKAFGMEGTAGELVKQFGGPLAAGAGGNWSAFSGEGTLLASAQATVNNPAGGMGFVPAGARAGAGVPGWSYGLAGIGGYMAGNMLGGGSPMASMLGAGGAMAGAFFGPQVLAAIGTAMAPGIGTLLGAVVGGLAGSLLGGIFGGEGDKQPVPRARLRQGITSPYQGVGTVTPFGAVGFSDIRVQHGMDQDLVNQGREFVATIRQFEESIAEVMDKEDIDRVKAALEGFTSDSTDFAGILRRRVQVIADAMDLSYRTLLGDTSQMDVGAIAERLGVLKELENALSKTMDDIFEAATIQSGGYDIKVADTLSRLKDEFDKWTGSTPQLEKITSLVEERYQLELDRLQEIKSVSENIQSGTEKLLQNLERAGQSQDDLLFGWRTQMSEAMASIGTLADPAEIQEAVADYQEAAQAAFGILSDLFRQFESARETIETAGTSRATAIRRGTMPATDLSAALQTEFAQRQSALQSATSPEELTKAFNDLQTTLNDWFAIEQSIIDKSAEQVMTMEELNLAIKEASKSISQSSADQSKSIRYSALKSDALIAALQTDFVNQRADLLSSTTPESITETYAAIESTLQQWLNAEQTAIQAANAELQTAEELQKTVDDLRKGLREFVEDLKISDLSPLKPSARLAKAQQQYFTILDKARAGDTESLEKLSDSAQEYLSQAKEFYASSPNYRNIFNSVVDALDTLQQQFNANDSISKEDEQIRALAEKFAERFESIAQIAINSLVSIQPKDEIAELTSTLAETFAQRFEAAAQMALERLATLQAEQLGGVGNLAELADQFQSGIAEMTRIAREQLQQLQDNALARYQEFTAALDETLRNGAGVLSDSLRTAFDAGAALIEEAVAGQYAATQQTATIIPFPLAAAMPASTAAAAAANQSELEEQLDAIVAALGNLGVIVQVSTREQTRELIKSQPIVREQPMKISTKQVL